MLLMKELKSRKRNIVQENATSLYRTKKDRPDCIIHGLQCEEGKERKQGSPMYLCSKVKSECNITPSSGLTSMAMSLILIHEDAHPSSVDKLNALIDTGSSHVTGATS